MLKIKFQLPSFAPRRIIRYKFQKLSLFVLSYLSLSLVLTALYVTTIPTTEALPQTKILGQKTSSINKKPLKNLAELKITITPSPTFTVTPTVTPQALKATTESPTPSPAPELENHTKTITNVKNDTTMASSSDIYNALNSYRAEHGAPPLAIDDNLTKLSLSRVNTFASSGDLDGHVGFRDFMSNNGFEISGFNGLGENSARISGPMQGDKIIREIFGQSEAHNTSQLDPAWTHVGISINGYFINVNFGKNRR